jgi:hypothetical protein
MHAGDNERWGERLGHIGLGHGGSFPWWTIGSLQVQPGVTTAETPRQPPSFLAALSPARAGRIRPESTLCNQRISPYFPTEEANANRMGRQEGDRC